jgi:hypothetical protein
MTQQKQPTKITGVLLRPPAETADKPPPLASHVRVAGGVDVLTLEFFHVSFEKMTAALDGRSGHGVEVQANLATIRSEPLARVAIPLNVGLDLLAQMLQTAMESVPELQQQIADVIAATAQSAQNAATKAREANTVLLAATASLRPGGENG